MSTSQQPLPGVVLPLFHSVVADLLSPPVQGTSPSGLCIRFRAEGRSMYPTIRDGELITVGPVATDHIVRGDVLLCRHATRVLAHRVVAVTGPGSARMLQLRGDANRACDAPVAASQVVGKVLSVRRNGRAISLCGCVARLRHTARTAASQAKASVVSTAAIAGGALSQAFGRGLPDAVLGYASLSRGRR